jgi:fibronectin type 3 domain-containing protein
LADGTHLLTGNELKPNASNSVPAFNFSVDTVPPPAPSAPTLAFTSDTGVKGDNITMLHNFVVTGTSATGAGITGVNAYWAGGSRFFGGAAPSGTGSWSITGGVQTDGVYVLQARATDEAANVSPLSSSVTVTVDSTPPASLVTSPASGATVSGTVSVAASASDATSGVASVAFQVDGVTQATDTTAPYTFAWNSAGVANGQHTLKEVATDVAGNQSTSSVNVNVQNGATVPDAPTLSSATAGSGNVALAWSAPTSDGGSAITGYKVYRGTSSGGEPILTTLGNVTSWTDNGVTNGTTYYYKVTAVNAIGEGPASSELSATPQAAAAAPGAPTLNSAAAGNATVALAWSAPASNGGSAINGYKVYRGTSSGGETLLTTLGNVTSWTDNGVTNGTTYYYKVTALNSVGESAASNERSATPSAPATAPGAPTLNSAGAGNGSVALAWSAPSSNGGSPVTGYRIYRGTSSGGETLLTTLGNVASWTDSGVTNGTTYYYKATALNSVGEGVSSNERSATPTAAATAPGAPTLTGASAGKHGGVALTWKAPTSNGGSPITGYRVYRGTSSGGETLLTTLGNVTSWTDNGAANGTTYYYQVSAVNAVGESARSNELSATPGRKGGHAIPLPVLNLRLS